MGNIVHLRKHRVAKKAVRYVLSFLLALVMTCMLLLTALEISFANQKVILDIFSSEAYAEKVQEYIMETSRRVTYTVGITEDELYGDSLDIDRIREQTGIYAKAMLESAYYESDVEAFKQEVYDNVLHYMDDRNLERSETNLAGAEDLAEFVADVYQSGIQFPYLANFAPILHKIGMYARFALVGGTVLCAFLLFLLFYSCRRKYHGARFVIYAALSAMLNIFVPTIVLYVSKIYEHLTIATSFIQYFIAQYMKICTGRVAWLCLIFIPVVFGLFIWEANAHKKAWNKDHKRHRHRHHHEQAES